MTGFNIQTCNRKMFLCPCALTVCQIRLMWIAQSMTASLANSSGELLHPCMLQTAESTGGMGTGKQREGKCKQELAPPAAARPRCSGGLLSGLRRLASHTVPLSSSALPHFASQGTTFLLPSLICFCIGLVKCDCWSFRSI